ncbi:MAG TPA: selenium cofactor biosynthesis protein YqeC [Acidobacteriota bacterium]|nr:selenium cofactor biosynthesis protein YqeC [Acidobacteriota bacterium]
MFFESFAFKNHSLVNFVGGGGKTALIYTLMRECCAAGHVLYTTTTRIHPPVPREDVTVFSSDNPALLRQMLSRVSLHCSDRAYKIAATRSFLSPTLLRGVPTDFIEGIERNLFKIFLNEADGAAGYSLKLPGENEPVLMENAEYLVPVIGVDCLRKAMGPKSLFRWRTSAALFSLREGDEITPDRAAGILMHPRGVCKHWKPGMTIIPFINKVETPGQETEARELADAVIRNGNFPVTRVLFGSAHRETVQSFEISGRS